MLLSLFLELGSIGIGFATTKARQLRNARNISLSRVETSMTTSTLLNVFQSFANKKNEYIDERVFGRKIGLATRLFGCQHYNVGRPFNSGNSAYRSCLGCGARKQFNTETLETYGTFYCPPVISQ